MGVLRTYDLSRYHHRYHHSPFSSFPINDKDHHSALKFEDMKNASMCPLRDKWEFGVDTSFIKSLMLKTVCKLPIYRGHTDNVSE